MNKEKIFEHLQNHYNELKKHFSENQILGVFLYGSQNYGTDTETSDVDTRAIYVPSLYDVLFNEPVSKEIIMENGEHCDVKDIREYMKCLKKSNITYMETLFTKYFIVNPIYEDIWKDTLIKNREGIAHTYPFAVLRAMSHTGLNLIKKEDCSGKDLANALRIYYFLINYLDKKPYEACLFIQNENLRKELLAIKATPKTNFNLEKLRNNFNYILSKAGDKNQIDFHYTDNILKSFVLQCFKRKEKKHFFLSKIWTMSIKPTLLKFTLF